MKRITVRMENKIHEFVREKSFATGKSMNEIIVSLLEKGLEKDRADFEKKQKKENEKVKEIMKIYKSGNKETAQEMYKEATGMELPEWLFDIME